MKRIIFYLLLLFNTQLTAVVREPLESNLAYSYNSYVDIELWDDLVPYFLPEDHPIKLAMDKIFLQKKRVTKSKHSLKKAKFKTIRKGEMHKAFIVSHQSLKGYLLKLYVDKQYKVSDGKRLKGRILGAQVVQETIDEYGFQSIFKVPKKWIYPLPQEPSPPDKKKYKRKNFVLVVEDMNILDKEKNKEKWKSSTMTEDLLDAIFTMIDEAGLSDSIYAFNIPFSHDGRLAFVDTEYYNKWPIHFGYLGAYFSPEMKEYWKMLIKTRRSHNDSLDSDDD